MILKTEGRSFEYAYYPFFRIETKDDFAVFGMRLPSGRIEEVLVFDDENPIDALYEYSEFLIREYVLEDDIMLTTRALELKYELMEIFRETR